MTGCEMKLLFFLLMGIFIGVALANWGLRDKIERKNDNEVE